MTGGIHEVASAGFSAGADAYERGRPSYPPDAVALLVDELGLQPGATVIELGAGTGKLTRLLVPSGARIVAVEPVADMRAQLERAAPSVEVRDGTAEAILWPDGAADAVVVAQAFHWFDADRALTEIHRVLRPGGALGLVWNDADESVEWVRQLREVQHWHSSGIPRYVDGSWKAAFERTKDFTPLQYRELHHDQELDEEMLVARVLSTSYIASQPDPARAEIAGRVRELVAGFPPRFSLPYRTDVYWCRRR